MTKFADRMFAWTVILCSSIYLLGLYWWFIDGRLFPVDKILTPPYLSATSTGDSVEEVRAGDIVYMHWHYELFRKCDNTFQRKLANSNTNELISMQDHHGLAPDKLGEIKHPSRMQLPANLEVGPWEYHLKGIFRCNPFKPQIVYYPSVAFRIVE